MIVVIVKNMIETPRIRKVCDLIAKGINSDPDQALDISQTAFLEIWENKDRYEIEIECPGDFYRVFRKRAVNANDRLKRKLKREVITEEFEMETLQKDIDLEPAIKALPEKEETVISLILGGYTFMEISRKLGICKKTVYSRKQSALIKLRSKLCQA